MKKTFIATMPDHVGAFAKASRVMAESGLNLTRVSYNKAVDVHTLFVEAEGTAEAMAAANARLEREGYLASHRDPGSVFLVEFRLPDRPGAANEMAELIGRYHFNISYISAQSSEELPEFNMKMGLFVEDPEHLAHFLNVASQMCPVRVIDYDRAEKILDNTVFYLAYSDQMAQQMDLDEERRTQLVINANLVMHRLEDLGEAFHRTFDNIQRFCDVLSECRGSRFRPRITEHRFGPDLHITLIEPPCGSNTCILRHNGEYLFIDTGYACYREEMLRLLRILIPDFDTCPKKALLTHADVDHCGLLDLFDTVYMTRRTKECLLADPEHGDFREQNPLYAPFIRICKTLTGHKIPPAEIIQVIGEDVPILQSLYTHIGTWQFGALHFDLYEGQGGHLPGELVLVERSRKLVFPGDIYINIKEMLPQQTAHNRYGACLMTSVDTAPGLSVAERKALPDLLGSGRWSLFSGHGPRMELNVD